jgi:N-acetyl-beta-hexosaminidase
MAYAFQQRNRISGSALLPYIFALAEGVPNVNSLSNQALVAFPQEELLFGREVTIDSLYVALNADVSENTFVDFYVNDVLYATLELDPATYNTVDLAVNPIEVQVFPLPAYGVGATTFKSPQLTMKIRSLTDTGTAFVRFTKIMELGSFDPNQRPT